MFFLLFSQWLFAAPDPGELIELAKMDFSIKQEMVYATPRNFLKKAVYSKPKCLLRRSVAEALVRVQDRLKLEGLGLKVWDCYRPLSVQQKMWEMVPDEKYVADPKKGSQHNRGAAVDITLVGREGQELEMPTAFDDFTEKAHRDYKRSSKIAQKNKNHLEVAMAKEGFTGLPTEWWHFDFKEAEKFPLEDLPLE